MSFGYVAYISPVEEICIIADLEMGLTPLIDLVETLHCLTVARPNKDVNYRNFKVEIE